MRPISICHPLFRPSHAHACSARRPDSLRPRARHEARLPYSGCRSILPVGTCTYPASRPHFESLTIHAMDGRFHNRLLSNRRTQKEHCTASSWRTKLTLAAFQPLQLAALLLGALAAPASAVPDDDASTPRGISLAVQEPRSLRQQIQRQGRSSSAGGAAFEPVERPDMDAVLSSLLNNASAT
jgi:hypothetical protein